jgi:hypothetical protein
LEKKSKICDLLRISELQLGNAMLAPGYSIYDLVTMKEVLISN